MAEPDDTVSMDVYREAMVRIVVRIGRHSIGQVEAAELEDAVTAGAKVAARWLAGER